MNQNTSIPIPMKELFPHFLKLILQNRAETEIVNAEAAHLCQQDSQCQPNETEVDDFELKEVNVESDIETVDKDPKKLNLVHQGDLYLKKAFNRTDNFAKKTDDITDAIHRRWSRTVWRQELNSLEPIYRLPVLIFRKFRYIRDAESTRIGPGTYDIDYKTQNKVTPAVKTNCTSRFPKEKIETDPTPGPGSYGDFYDTYERSLDKCRHAGRVTLLQSGPCNVRTVMDVKNSNPGPGKYEVDSGIELMLNKRTSSKGPYDLYTPPRNIIPYGYFKTRPDNPIGPGQYNIRLSLKQELNNCCNHYKGKFCEIERNRKITGERMTLVAPLWSAQDNFPSPAHYTPEVLFKDVKQFKFGFNRTAPARTAPRLNYDMAPDKYRPELWQNVNIPTGHGWESDFISKTGRVNILKSRVLYERVRAKDIPHHQQEPDEGLLMNRAADKIHCKYS